MVGNKTPNLKRGARFIVAALVVLSTYGIWAVKTWHGEPTNPLLVVMAIVVTIAGARVVFGKGAISKAVEVFGEVAGAARELNKPTPEEPEDEEEDS